MQARTNNQPKENDKLKNVSFCVAIEQLGRRRRNTTTKKY
jgi:hypothetical protein